MEQVTSRQNALVRELRELARGRGAGDVALLDGPHVVAEALASGVELRVVVLAAGATGPDFTTLASRASAAGARIVTLPDRLFESVSPVRHPSGIVSIARVTRRTAADVLRGDAQLVLLVDRVQDPGNVGAIIRAAEACGASGVITGPGSADPLGWKALRGGMGSTFRLPVASTDSLESAIGAARSAGLRVLATAPRGGTPLASVDLRGPSAILLGGEGPGLPPEVVAEADERITIPMRPPVESLNVAIAAALVLYEALRQRT